MATSTEADIKTHASDLLGQFVAESDV